jgi:hypothetical protein
MVMKKDFMDALLKELEKYTTDNILLGDEESGQWVLRTVLATSPEKTDYVMLEATIYAAREDVDLLEIFVRLGSDIESSATDELVKAFAELNYFSPVGTFGIHPEQGYAFLRECYILDREKDISALVKDAVLGYELVMEAVMASYPGLSEIWKGNLSFGETLEQELLNKHSKKVDD